MDQHPSGIPAGLPPGLGDTHINFLNRWPEGVRAIYQMMAASQQPMMMSWGPDLITAYNAPFVPILGHKHPRVFGLPYRELWAEVWPALEPLIASVLAGQAAFYENMEFVLAGRDQATGWFSFSITPVRDGAGAVGGFAIAVVETTATVLIQRRLDFGLALEQALQINDGADAIIQDAASLLGKHLRVQRCAYADVDLAAETLRIVTDWTDGDIQGLTGAQPLAIFPADSMAVLRAGHPISTNGTGIDAGPGSAGSWLRPASLIMPVVKGETLVALLLVDQQQSRAWTDDDRGLLCDVANRTWAAAARVRAEAAIQELNRTLELRVAERTAERDRLWRIAQELIVLMSEDDTVLSVNPASHVILGYTADEMLGQNAAVFMHPEDLEAMRRYRSAGGGTRATVENRCRHRDGSYRTILWNVVREGGVTYATGRDVTQKRIAQAQLEQSEARLKAMFETNYQMQALLEVDGRLIATNATALNAIQGVGAPAVVLQDVVGRLFWDTPWFSGTPGQPELIRNAVLAAGRGESFRAEIDSNMPTGRRRFDLSIRPIRDNQGAIVAIMPEGVDITEQRATQEALRQSQKMEAVGQLTGGLAHDFNNLLTGIGGALELIQVRIADGRLADATRYAAAAQESARRAAAITHRLLAFSRQQTLLPRLLNAGQLVSDMAELIRGTVGPAITLDLQVSAGLPSILADANQLENAVLNLCLNARDAMPNGGQLVLRTEAMPVNADLPGPVVAVSVADTGAGMPPDVAVRAFDPFFTTKPIGTGTGLGLSMVYGFVRQSGGQVHIASVPGAGTTVTLFFPARLDIAAAASAPATPAPGPGWGETVLVVEDEEAIRLLIEDVLQDYRYTSLLAADAAGGLAALRSDRRIDLLITDIGLPGAMNGRQLADAARKLRRGLPVLMMTGFAAAEILGHDRLEPGMAIMTKPFTMAALAQRIQELLAHSSSS